MDPVKKLRTWLKNSEFAPTKLVECPDCLSPPQNRRKIMKTAKRDFGPKTNQPKRQNGKAYVH